MPLRDWYPHRPTRCTPAIDTAVRGSASRPHPAAAREDSRHRPGCAQATPRSHQRSRLDMLLARRQPAQRRIGHVTPGGRDSTLRCVTSPAGHGRLTSHSHSPSQLCSPSGCSGHATSVYWHTTCPPRNRAATVHAATAKTARRVSQCRQF